MLLYIIVYGAFISVNKNIFSTKTNNGIRMFYKMIIKKKRNIVGDN